MIRSVAIPTKVSRMGCAPGSGCCDECGSHAETGPPIGPAETHTHLTFATGARNQALHRALGETQCDPDGNCYTDGVLTAAPLTTGSGCPPGVASCGSSTGPSTATLLYLGAGVLAILLLEATSRRR